MYDIETRRMHMQLEREMALRRAERLARLGYSDPYGAGLSERLRAVAAWLRSPGRPAPATGEECTTMRLHRPDEFGSRSPRRSY